MRTPFRLMGLSVAIVALVAGLTPGSAASGTAVSGQTTPAVSYRVSWLDPPDGAWSSVIPRGMNNRGDIVGYASGPASKGVVWTPETGPLWAQDLAVLPPSSGNIVLELCTGINDDRVIVGSCRIGSYLQAYRLPLVLDDETRLPVPQPIEILSYANGYDVNEIGDLAVANYVPATTSYAVSVLLHDAATGSLNPVSIPASVVEPGRLNNLDQFVGRLKRSERGGITRHYGFGFHTATKTLTTYPGFVTPGAYDTGVSGSRDINDLGQAVGWGLFKAATKSSPGLKHACLFNASSKPLDLGVLGANPESEANGINIAGHVVGVSGNDGFLWTPEHKMHNLDNLVLSDADWFAATKIVPAMTNSPQSTGGYGQISGYARIAVGGGTTIARTFLLTPVPIP